MDDLGTLGEAVAILSGANPVAASAISVILGTVGGWFFGGRHEAKKQRRAKKFGSIEQSIEVSKEAQYEDLE